MADKHGSTWRFLLDNGSMLLPRWLTASLADLRRPRYADYGGRLLSRKRLVAMAWPELEALVVETFRRKGFAVKRREGSADLELHLRDACYLVLGRHWQALKLGLPVVRELEAARLAEAAAGAFIITAGQLSDEAKAFIAGRPIERTGSGDLLRLVAETRQAALTHSAMASTRRPPCPRCGEIMIMRLATRGQHKGEKFWGCPRYPICPGMPEG